MDIAILKVMEAEAQQLEAKLSAIRSVISLYRNDASAGSNVTPALTQTVAPIPVATKTAIFRALMERQTNVDIVRRVAIEAVSTSPTLPVPTREIMRELERQGVHVVGAVPQNVVSSILSRTPELMSNGRSGWTLTPQEFGVSAPNENGALNSSAASAPETAPDAQ